ncbi:MAG: hypothetical protein GY766_18505 [Herbaspirillum sp.]|uniref:hypothetical protein n=1 Tax=Herbaspirillum sp. TaxID=1890675 RepID=UPI002583D534|nr:hypothetical protein [Herbaspirillum sp.]MCP3656856.1 hypothetical protein [Herbaspirillum sp.]
MLCSQDWRQREAALCAFGTVMVGPSRGKLSGLVSQILCVVVKLMSDERFEVRLSAVWVLGRICSELPEAVDGAKGNGAGEVVLGPLVMALNGGPLMAEKACWCIASLCGHHVASGGSGSRWMYSGQNGRQMVGQLLGRVAKRDVTGSLVITLHEALNTLIAGCPVTDAVLIPLLGQQLVPSLCQQLFAVVESMKRGGGGGGSSESAEVLQYRMGGLLSTIQVALHRVREAAECAAEATGSGIKEVLSPKLTDELMECCCTVLDAEHSLVYEEALGVMTYIGHCVGGHFMKYLRAQKVQDLLCSAVRTGAGNEDICRVGVGSVGDVYSACNEVICSDPLPLQQYTDRMVQELLLLLIDGAISLSLKQHIIGALTDMMLAHGPRASRYSGDVLSRCLEIGVLRPPQSADEELWDDFNSIRREICDVVRSCMLDLKGAANGGAADDQSRQRMAQQITAQINKFVEAVAADLQHADNAVINKCILLLSDAALFCQKNRRLKELLKTQGAQRILERAGKQRDDQLLAEAATECFRNLNE